MTKKNFVSLILGTIGGVLFAIGMCMCMLPEWNVFNQGVIVGSAGAVVLIAMLLVRRKIEGKPMLMPLSLRTIGIILLAIVGALALGIGMCMTMLWNMLVFGIIVGLIGIVMLLALIPLCKGLKG